MQHKLNISSSPIKNVRRIIIVGLMIYVGRSLPLEGVVIFRVKWWGTITRVVYPGAPVMCTTDTQMSSPRHCQDSTEEHWLHWPSQTASDKYCIGMLLFWFWVRASTVWEATTGSWEFKMVRLSPQLIVIQTLVTYIRSDKIQPAIYSLHKSRSDSSFWKWQFW